MADRRDVHYSEMGITSLEMLPALITGTEQDVVDAAYISREHAEKSKYADNDRTEDSLRHMLLGGLIELNPEQEETLGRDLASFLIDFREGSAPEDQVDLNNNEYGRRLREMYPDREEFIAKAIEIADAMVEGKEAPELDGVSLQKSYGSFETPERLAEFEKENAEGVYEKGPDGTWQFTEKARKEREALGLDVGGLLSRPPRMLKPEEKEKWTDDTIDLMNRMQFDSDEIVDRTPNLPSLMRQIDEYLVGEAPYYANVDRDSIGASRIFLGNKTYGGYATESDRGKQAFYAGATEQPAQDDYILHETGHLSEEEMRHNDQEAAVTFLDFYRNAKRLQNPELSEDDRFMYEDRIRTAKAYLKKQGFDLDIPEDATHVAGLASNYVLSVGLSLNPDLSMDEYRETSKDLKSIVDLYNNDTKPSTQEMAEGGLMLAPGGAVTKAVKNVLAPTAVALGLSESEEAEAAYIPLKAFAEGSDAAKAFFAKAQKRIDEGADTTPNGELYNEMGVYRSEDGDLKVDVPELRARDVEAMNAIANFQEDLNFYLKSSKQRRKKTSNPITRYLPENSPIFENFPQLKNTRVVMQPSKDNAGGGVYRTSTGELIIYVDPGANLSDDVHAERIAMKTMNAFNTFIHEFQHHIQDVKKAANTGYNTVASLVGFRGFKQDYFDAVDAIDKLQPGEVGYDQFKNRIDMMFDLVRDSFVTQEKRVAFDQAEYADKLKIVQDRIENFEKTKPESGVGVRENALESRSFGEGIYYRELGEAEARSAAAKGLLVGDQRKAVGIYYPKDTNRSRRVLSPEDIELEDQIENTHILTRVVPAYNFNKLFDSDMRELEVTGAAPKKPSLLEKEQQNDKKPLKGAGTVAGAGAVAGLAAPPSEAFVAGLGFEDATPTPSLFDVGEGAIPNELGITNTFLLDLLVPRTKPYDLITSLPGIGEGLMAADVLSSFRADEPQDYPEVIADAP